MSEAKITARQKAAFWRTFSAACAERGITSFHEREAWRHKILREQVGKAHLANLNATTDYDKVMAYLCEAIGDYQAASRFASGGEKRAVRNLMICCAQIMQIKGAAEGSDAAKNYLAGVLEQSRIACGTDARDASFWLDLSPDSIITVFCILDTYRRKLLRGLIPAGSFFGFDPAAKYEPREGGCRISWDAKYYDDYGDVRVNVVR